MKKIINFILVRRPENLNKWWDRLFLVLLFCSAIILCIGIAFFSIYEYNHRWVSYNLVSVKFETDYQKANGKEYPCDINYNYPLSDIVSCNGVNLSSVDSKKYIDLLNDEEENLEKKFGLDKYNFSNCPERKIVRAESALEGVDLERIDCITKIMKNRESDPAYSLYQDSIEDISRAKFTQNLKIGIMVRDVSLWLIIPILSLIAWILFWSSIVYRLILYIVFGENKK